LFLSKGEVYVKTLLERAKGSALDITTGGLDPIGAITLLPPHTKQIRYLHFACDYWASIQKFSEVNSGPLPLLTTLRISAINEINLEGPDHMTPPSLPLFSNAVNLKEFFLNSGGSPFLSHFRFPNLTTFELSTMPEGDFRVSQLLDFLEGSPMLRMVDVKITADIALGDVPQERVIVLPNLKSFYLFVTDGGPGREIAVHISCPSAKYTSLLYETHISETTPREIFPSPVSWNAIIRQHSRSPVEEVTLDIRIALDPIVACYLTFRSFDASVIKLGFNAIASGDESDDEPSEGIHSEVFSQASRIIRDHPLLANVKRLRFNHGFYSFRYTLRGRITNEVRQLFKSVGPLEELTLNGCDLRSYLTPLVDPPEPSDIEQPLIFPQIKELKILHPTPSSWRECMGAVVKLAKSQHALEVPFERVTITMAPLPETIAEELRPWVGVVDCCEEWYMEDDE
jgi:hypothetical protein